MGISPDDTFTYWFPGELSKPESERRGLVYRHGNAAFWRTFAADKNKAEKAPTSDNYLDGLLELAKRGLVGWVGFDRTFDGAIEELPIVEGEIVGLTDDLRSASVLSALEKKRSLRQSPSTADCSVKSA